MCLDPPMNEAGILAGGDAALRSTTDSELEMLQMQELVAQRQRAIALTASLVQALHDAARQVAANLGSQPPTESEASSSDHGGGGCELCSHDTTP